VSLEQIKELQGQVAEMFTHIKGLHEDVKAERKSLDTAAQKGNEWLDKLQGVDLEAVKTVSTKLGEVEEKLQKLQLEAQRPAAPLVAMDAKLEAKLEPHWRAYLKGTQARPELSGEVKAQATGAFWKYARMGAERMSLDEVKLLSTEDQTQGGYLVVPEFANEIIKDLANINEVRSIARVQTTGSNSFRIPKRTTRLSGGWVGEGAASGESNSKYGLVDIPNGHLRAHSRATLEQLSDSRFDMESLIRMDFVEDYDRLEGVAFVDGNGVQKPRGFMTHPDVVSVNGGDAALLTYKGMVRLSHGDTTNGDWNPQYLRNARFGFSSTTLGEVRLLENTAGNLIFAAATDGGPATVLGYPYTLLPGMPAIAANALPVAFGDFRQAYTIVDRVGFAFLRDPFSESKDGVVVFLGFKRVGGDVTNEKALRKLKIAA
jgi:HK97 family phage major capsid protein